MIESFQICEEREKLLLETYASTHSARQHFNKKYGLIKRCHTAVSLRWCQCAACVIFMVIVAEVLRLYISQVPSSCSNCPALYYTATACLLGGQSLARLGWDNLFHRLSPGEVRSKLEALLRSPQFKASARCPRWSKWDESRDCCVTDPRGRGDSCPANFHSTWKANLSTPSYNCTANFVQTPWLNADQPPADTCEICEQLEPSVIDTEIVGAPCDILGFRGDWSFEKVNHMQPCSVFVNPGCTKWTARAGAARVMYDDCGPWGILKAPGGLCITRRNYSFALHLEECSSSIAQLWSWRRAHLLHSSGWCLFNNPWTSGNLQLWLCPDTDPVSDADWEWLKNLNFEISFGVLKDGQGRCFGPDKREVRDATCTCPDHTVYLVGDLDTDCRSLGCFGGEPGACDAGKNPNLRATVTCQPNFEAAGRLEDALPSEDTECWRDQQPLFVWPGFFRSCHNFAPNFIWWPDWSDTLSFKWRLSRINHSPMVPKFSDFNIFYDMFYNTPAGDLCKSHFGQGTTSPGFNLTRGSAVSLRHNSSKLHYEHGTLADTAKPWIYDDGRLRRVPGQFIGALLFVGLGEPEVCWARNFQMTPAGTLVLTPDIDGDVIIWSHDGGGIAAENVPELMTGHGGLPQLGWDSAGTMDVVKNAWDKEALYTMQICSKQVTSGSSLEIPIEPFWVGGLAFKQKEIN